MEKNQIPVLLVLNSGGSLGDKTQPGEHVVRRSLTLMVTLRPVLLSCMKTRSMCGMS